MLNNSCKHFHPVKYVIYNGRCIKKEKRKHAILPLDEDLVLCLIFSPYLNMFYQNKLKNNVTFKPGCYLLIAIAGIISMSACKTGKNPEELVKDSLLADSLKKAAAGTVTTTTTKVTTIITSGKAVVNPQKKNGRGEIIVERNQSLEDAYAGMMIEMDTKGIYYRTEVKPSYPGGEKALTKFIQENIVYPPMALDNGAEGNLVVNFAVDEMGVIYTPYINGEEAGYGLDEAALKVVSKMPRWNPGQIKGRNVKSYFSLPIKFRIY